MSAKNCFYLETDSDIDQINSLIEIYNNKDKTRKKRVRELSKVKLPSCRGLPANIVPSQHPNCEKLKNGTCRVKPIVRQTFKSLKQAPKSKSSVKSSVKTTAKKFVKKSSNPILVHPKRPRGPAGRKRPTRKKRVQFPGFPKKTLVYTASYPYSGFQWRYQSCYLASIIQMITHLSPLVDIIRNPPKGDMDRHPILVILDELMSVMTKYQVVPKKYFSSIHSETSFRVKLDKLLVGFDIAEDSQQDSTEIFSLILGGGGMDTPEYDRFRNLSMVNIQSTMTCVECNTPKLSQELQSPLNIPLIKQERSRSRKAHYSIEDLLTNTYGQVENLDSDNKVECEVCKKLELFTRVNLIHSHPNWTRRSAQPPLPPVLFLSFNRFRFNMRRNARIKIDTRITFSPILDLSPYLTEVTKEVDARYRLVSVIHHMGTSADAGHYYCYNLVVNKDKEPEWIKFDDADVSRIEQKRPDILPEELFCSDSRNKGLAYMLAYQKLDIPLQRYDPLPVDPKLLHSDSDSESNDLFEFNDSESDSDGSESVLHCNEIIIENKGEKIAYQVVIDGREKGNIYIEDDDDGPVKVGTLKCYRNDDPDSRQKYKNLEQHDKWIKDKLKNDTRWKT